MDYFCYWKPRTVEINLANHATDDEGLDHTAGNQLGRIKRGDVLWIVTVDRKRLWLVGRVRAEKRLTAREVKKRFPGRDIWAAKWHVLAPKGKAEPMKKVDISKLARKIEFTTKAKKLPPQFSGQHLQTMRPLSLSSVKMLTKEWGKPTPPASSQQENDEDDVYEGDPKLKKHKTYERSLEAKRRAKNYWRKKLGHLVCWVCDFDFEATYGKHGADFIEMHHVKQLSIRGKRHVTDPKLLVPLCSNCHRMVHRRSKKPLSLSQLRQRMASAA